METTIKLDPIFYNLVKTSNDAFALIDRKSEQFVAINQSFSKMLGYTLQELIQTGVSAFYGFSANENAIKQLQNAANGETYKGHVKLDNGETLTIELASTPIRIQGQDFLLLLHERHSQETSSKESENPSSEQIFNESEAKWQAITENSPDHIMMIDTNGIILFINHTVPNLTVEQVIGKSCYDLTQPDQLTLVKEKYSTAIKTGKPVQFDSEYKIGDTAIFFDNRVAPVFRDGQVVALTVTCRDVTDRVKALKQLEKSQQHLRHALEAGKTGTWEWDTETNEVTWSDGVEAMFGLEPGSFEKSYDAFKKLVHPDDAPIIESSIEQSVENNAPYYVEYRCMFPDGTTRWFNSQGSVYRDKQGNPLRMIGTVTDISQRKIDEERFERQEFLLSKSQEIAHIGSYSWDIKTNNFYWSDEIHKIFGIAKEEFDGHGPTIIDKAIHPDDRERIFKAQQYVMQEKKPYPPMEYRVVRPDGSIRHVWADGHINLDEKGEVVSMIGTLQDITERKKAEENLLKSQQKLSMHLQHTPLGVIDWNTDLEVIEWNPAAESIFGYSREEALGKSAFDLILDSSLKPHIDEVWNALITRTGGKKNTNENLTKDGGTIVCEWYNTPLVDNEGKVIGVSSLVQDISERVQTQKELEKHRLHLEELVAERTEEIHEQALMIDQIHDSVVSTDLDGFVTSWNKGAERIYGYKSEQAIGQHISFVYPEDQHDYLRNEIIPQLKEKGELETEVITQRKSGERFYVSLSLSVTHDLQGNPTGLIGYAMDITERKKTEEKILRQQKALEAANKELEAFSYSVSHDLRAPLRAIDGFSSALLDDYYDMLDEQGKKNFQRIRNNAQRMSDLIDDLLQLSRVTRHEINKETVSLSHLAQDIIQKYKYENPERNIEIKIETDLNVDGDPRLLRIALDNLISNAWKYTTKTDTPKIELFHTQINGNSTFGIKDNGVGFDMRYVDKLFGAFQRLHHPEEFSGNGIGLATVSRIINRHGGKIWAEGAIDQGATFFFTLNES